MSLSERVNLTLMAAVLLAVLTACEQEGPAEQAGRSIDHAAEKSGEMIDKAVDITDEVIDDTVEQAGEMTEDIEDTFQGKTDANK